MGGFLSLLLLPVHMCAHTKHWPYFLKFPAHCFFSLLYSKQVVLCVAEKEIRTSTAGQTRSGNDLFQNNEPLPGRGGGGSRGSYVASGNVKTP